MNGPTMLTIALAAVVLAGCLQGERPRIADLYPDQVASVTSPAAASPGDSSTAVPASPGAGVPTSVIVETQTRSVTSALAGAQASVQIDAGSAGRLAWWTGLPPYPPGPYPYAPYYGVYDGCAYGWPCYGSAAAAPTRLTPGEKRYYIPSDNVRCDNLRRTCAQVSKGQYVYDPKATRQVYGPPGRPFPRPGVPIGD